MLENDIKILAGDHLEKIDASPLIPYSYEVIDFLSELSTLLLKDKSNREFADIISFAYWIRKSNLERLSRNLNRDNLRIGRGLTLHIAPNNVPINFAFSFVFGLLAGNANIVRVGESEHIQIKIICKAIKKLFNLRKHKKIADMNRIIRYPRNNLITERLSLNCNARVLWGGNNTILNFKSFKTRPRCIDICFADRYSFCILGADEILKANPKETKLLANNFYNDVYLFDQNACSSPHLIIWQGKEKDIREAQKKFWNSIESLIKAKSNFPNIHSIEKYSQLCRSAIMLDGRLDLVQSDSIYRIKLKNLTKEISNLRGKYGFFIEAVDNNLENLKKIVDESYQTVTYYGIDQYKISKKILSLGLTGIDRIVPIGKALDIGVIWDGYDMIGSLSRIVSIE